MTNRFFAYTLICFIVFVHRYGAFGNTEKIFFCNDQLEIVLSDENCRLNFIEIHNYNELFSLPADSLFLLSNNLLPLLFNPSKHSDNSIKKRLTAALLTVCLGPLGVHRLYLGCSPMVPAVYVATLGGGLV